jgi:DNA-binding CsgD family transcriptional regulator/PAS domain-containing protein
MLSLAFVASSLEIVMREHEVWQNSDGKLIAELYDAAVTLGGSSLIPTIISKLSSSVSGGVCIFGAGEPKFLSHDIPEEAIGLYREHYCSQDPWTRHTLANAKDGYFAPVIGRRIVPERRLNKTEFFADFAGRFDMAEVLGGSVRIDAGVSAVYSMHRSKKMQLFQSRDEERMRRFAPHLQRALQLNARLGQNAAIGFAALDALALGTVVCDRNGHVLFANSAAEQTAKPGGAFILGNGKKQISALHPAQRQAVLNMVRSVCNGGAGGNILLTNAVGEALILQVTQLPRRYGAAVPLALITMNDANARLFGEAARLSDLFGLTRAEALLAKSLADGASLAEARAQRGTTENTVRSQLREIFRKTGTSTQAELARLMGRIPQLL